MSDVMTILANDLGMQNVYTPLTMDKHLLFCFMATVIYLAQFYRKGSWHYLIIMAAVDLTFLTQTSLSSSRSAINALGVVEALLLITAFIFYLKASKQEKAAQKAAQDGDVGDDDKDHDDEQRQRLAQKIKETKDKKFIENAFEDDDE